MNTTNTLGGRYKLQAFVPGHPPRVLADWFSNLITDYGMDSINSYYEYIWAYCSVGSGAAAPAFSNTQLAGKIATTSSQVSAVYGAEADYIWRRITYQFPQGAAAGNLAEVGVGAKDNGSGLFSRALIKDAQGTPTTITVLPDEVLQVIWEFRLYYPTQTTTLLDISGSGNHEVTVDIFDKNSWRLSASSFNHFYVYSSYLYLYAGVAGIFPATQSSITSYSANDSIYTGDFFYSYLNGSFQVKKKYVIPVHLCNFSDGINLIKFGASNSTKYQAYIDPPIMKTTEKQLTLNLSFNWARA